MLLSVIIMTGLYAMAQSFTLKGKVTDEDGNALELATVSCVEQATVTMTNLKGEFQVKLQSADSDLAPASYVTPKPRRHSSYNCTDWMNSTRW